jgi:hypothetical protein
MPIELFAIVGIAVTIVCCAVAVLALLAWDPQDDL